MQGNAQIRENIANPGLGRDICLIARCIILYLDSARIRIRLQTYVQIPASAWEMAVWQLVGDAVRMMSLANVCLKQQGSM